MSNPANDPPAREDAGTRADGEQAGEWPYVGKPRVYAPLSPWTRFQGGGFYVMLFTVFGICWTLLCGAGIYYGMRNVAVVKGIGFWDAVRVRSGTGLWLWIQVWLYPVLSAQIASILIRLYYKRKGRPLHPSLSPGPVEPVKR